MIGRGLSRKMLSGGLINVDDGYQNLDYNGLIMAHLNRLSFVSTSSFIEAVSKQSAENYENPLSSGQKSLEWGCHFLYCLIPDDFQDKDFVKDREAYLKVEGQTMRDFAKLKALINLLNRRGLLLSKQLPGKKPTGEVWD